MFYLLVLGSVRPLHVFKHLGQFQPQLSYQKGSYKKRLYRNFRAHCNACYVGETTQHFSTRIRERLTDRPSHIFLKALAEL